MKVANAEKQGPRPGVLLILVAAAIVLITVWSRESETGPLHRLRVGVQAVTAPVSAAGEFMTRPVRGFFAWAGDLGVSRSQLEQLRQQNAQLRSRVAELEEARLENERLRGLIDLAQAREYDAVGARVIGKPVNSWEGVVLINRGSDAGLKPGMPVVSAQGLLGQTIEVSPSSAKVRLITDQRSGVAAFVQRSRVEGIVRGSIEGDLSLDFVSNETTVAVGDVVITSGMGGVYPKGIVIGEISAVDAGDNALYQRIEVTPASNLAGIEEVLVLVGAPEAQAPIGSTRGE